jgi:hypothetical protein
MPGLGTRVYFSVNLRYIYLMQGLDLQKSARHRVFVLLQGRADRHRRDPIRQIMPEKKVVPLFMLAGIARRTKRFREAEANFKTDIAQGPVGDVINWIIRIQRGWEICDGHELRTSFLRSRRQVIPGQSAPSIIGSRRSETPNRRQRFNGRGLHGGLECDRLNMLVGTFTTLTALVKIRHRNKVFVAQNTCTPNCGRKVIRLDAT